MITARSADSPGSGRFYCRRNQHLVTAGLLAAAVSGIGLLWAACWRFSGEPAMERRLGGSVEEQALQRAQSRLEASAGEKRSR